MPTLAIDLLGFGKSPRPSWDTYDTRSHAACVAATLRAHRISGPIVLVGHSLGSLIAIDVARKRPWQVQSLLLISPPFYQAKFVKKRLSQVPEEFVRKLYNLMRNNPEHAERFLKFAMRNRVFNKGFDADSLGVDSYVASLSSAILNQNSFRTIQQLEQPVHIITGKLDVLILEQPIAELAKSHGNISWQAVLLGTHEIYGPLKQAVVARIKKLHTQANAKR